jgi:hypothetical protein
VAAEEPAEQPITSFSSHLTWPDRHGARPAAWVKGVSGRFRINAAMRWAPSSLERCPGG